jgi:hypothetical protein
MKKQYPTTPQAVPVLGGPELSNGLVQNLRDVAEHG